MSLLNKKNSILSKQEVEDLLKPDFTPLSNIGILEEKNNSSSETNINNGGLNTTINSTSLSEKWEKISIPAMSSLELAIRKMKEIAKLIEENISSLNMQFLTLANNSMNQAGIVEKVIKKTESLTVEGEEIKMTEFYELFNKAFSSSIEKIIFISQQSISMVYSLDDAMESIKDIQAFNTRIQAINKQTNLLSLNATIESARAGEMGKGFAVVADEVRHVSKEINKLSEEMSAKIQKVTDSVSNGYKILKEVATTDMSDNISIKRTLEGLMSSLLSQTKEFSDILTGTAEDSKNMSSSISGMVQKVQFQDKTTQFLENISSVLSEVKDYISSFGSSLLSAKNDFVIDKFSSQMSVHDNIKNKLNLSELKREYNIIVAGYGISLQEDVAGVANNTINSSSDDEIVLF